jgi:hypothetical protein
MGVNRHILFGNFSPTVGGSFVEISRIIQIKAFRLYKKTTDKECGKHRRRKYSEWRLKGHKIIVLLAARLWILLTLRPCIFCFLNHIAT